MNSRPAISWFVEPVGDERDDLALAVGQLIELVWGGATELRPRGEFLDQAARGGGRQQRFSCSDEPYQRLHATG